MTLDAALRYRFLPFATRRRDAYVRARMSDPDPRARRAAAFLGIRRGSWYGTMNSTVYEVATLPRC